MNWIELTLFSSWRTNQWASKAMPIVMHYCLPVSQFIKKTKQCQFSSVTSLCTRLKSALAVRRNVSSAAVVRPCKQQLPAEKPPTDVINLRWSRVANTVSEWLIRCTCSLAKHLPVRLDIARLITQRANADSSPYHNKPINVQRGHLN